MRRVVLAVVAVLSATLAVVGAPSVGLASHANTHHVGHYYWGGAIASDSRGLWIMDRTGDPGVQEAIATFVAGWNHLAAYDAYDNGGATSSGTWLPVVNWFASADRDCSPYANQGTDWSVVTVCTAQPGTGEADTFRTGFRDSHGSLHTVSARIRIAPAWVESVAGCDMRSTIAHEMGHVMGLDHIAPSQTSSLWWLKSMMASTQNGGPSNLGGCPTWVNTHDIDQLAAIYTHALG